MSHPEHDIFENRTQFQLERMILFSDAVFAIVITLLAIEIKVPQITETRMLTGAQLKEHLFRPLFQLGGFIMSFFIVGMFWTTHHRIFSYVINYDYKLIWLNLTLLLMISILPFSTSLVSQYGYLDLAFGIYCFNLGLIGLMSFFISLHISNPNKKLSAGLEDVKMRKLVRVRSFIIACIFFSGALLCSLNYKATWWAARFIFFLIFPAISIIKRIYGVKTVVHKAVTKAE